MPLRDVQEAASHADPRATMRYERARVSPDRHATFIVAAFLAGTARPDEAFNRAPPLPPRDRLVVDDITDEEWKAFQEALAEA